MQPFFSLLAGAAAVLLGGCGAGVAGNAGPQLNAGTSTHVDAPPAAPAPPASTAPVALQTARP